MMIYFALRLFFQSTTATWKEPFQRNFIESQRSVGSQNGAFKRLVPSLVKVSRKIQSSLKLRGIYCYTEYQSAHCRSEFSIQKWFLLLELQGNVMHVSQYTRIFTHEKKHIQDCPFSIRVFNVSILATVFHYAFSTILFETIYSLSKVYRTLINIVEYCPRLMHLRVGDTDVTGH